MTTWIKCFKCGGNSDEENYCSECRGFNLLDAEWEIEYLLQMLDHPLDKTTDLDWLSENIISLNPELVQEAIELVHIIALVQDANIYDVAF